MDKRTDNTHAVGAIRKSESRAPRTQAPQLPRTVAAHAPRPHVFRTSAASRESRTRADPAFQNRFRSSSFGRYIFLGGAVTLNTLKCSRGADPASPG